VPYLRFPAQLVSSCSAAHANARERNGLAAVAEANFRKVRLFKVWVPCHATAARGEWQSGTTYSEHQQESSLSRSRGTKTGRTGLAPFGNSETRVPLINCREIAISLIDHGCERNRRITTTTCGLPIIRPQSEQTAKEPFLLRSSVKRSHHAQVDFLSVFSGFLK
jgi:hypothetical protein